MKFPYYINYSISMYDVHTSYGVKKIQVKKTISLVRTRIYPSFELFYFKVYSCLSISKMIKTGDKSYLSCLLHVPYRNAYALYLEGCPIIYYI